MGKYSDKYLNYLGSDKWREQRAKAFEHDGNMCAICGSTKHLEGHHIRYGLMGTEQDWLEVLTVCHDCHVALEKIKEEKRIKALEETEVPAWEKEADRYILYLVDLVNRAPIGKASEYFEEAIRAIRAINRGEDAWRKYREGTL